MKVSLPNSELDPDDDLRFSTPETMRPILDITLTTIILGMIALFGIVMIVAFLSLAFLYHK